MCFITKFVTKFIEYGRITDDKSADRRRDGTL